jgi:murein DD-endopeptidase MepM/ murein hydrolase activator NlpD
MNDIIAAQHVQRRSKPSFLSAAEKYKTLQHGIQVFSDNSFIADQQLPKRKKKRLLEIIRSSVKAKSGKKPDFFMNLRASAGRLSGKTIAPVNLRRTISLWEETRQVYSAEIRPGRCREQKFAPPPGSRNGFFTKVTAFFARIPRKVSVAVLLCLTVGCFALRLNYIPEPDPPEERAAREHGLRPAPVNEDEGDVIPLDLTETFAWQNYKVRSGDSVEGISRRFGLSLDAIIASNNLRNVRQLRAGDNIRIPNMDGIPYKIKSGDSYSKIANSFGVPLEAILDANDIQNDTVTLDTVLFIPGAKMDKSALRQALGNFFIWPISGRISSGFGWRNDPFTGLRSFHAGLDIPAFQGASVKAALDGRVSATGYNAVYGNFIIITHSPEYETMYGHLSKILVKKDGYITQGGIIGLVGNTGRSTGSHLHFSVYKNKRAINPLEILNR